MVRILLEKYDGLSKKDQAWVMVWTMFIVLIAVPVIDVICWANVSYLIRPFTILCYLIYCEKLVKEFNNKKFRIPALIFFTIIIIEIAIVRRVP